MTGSAIASVIVVSYNSRSDIAACLGQIVEDRRFEVVIVDNASVDDTVEQIETLLPTARLIKNDENVGFAKAVNLAASMVGSDVIVLLNPDCRISPEGLARLVDRSAGGDGRIVAPQIGHPNARLSVRSAGYEPTLKHMLNQTLSLPRLSRRFRGFNLYEKGESHLETSVDWVSGACFAVPAFLWRRLGGMSERWFMYGEDLDFCRRAREQQIEVIHSSEIRATHEVGASSRPMDGVVWTLWIENLADYYRVTFRPGAIRWRLWRVVAAASQLTRALAYLTRSSFGVRRKMWKLESRKFFAYATAVYRYEGPSS